MLLLADIDDIGPGTLLVGLLPMLFLAVLIVYGLISTTVIWWRERRERP